MTVTKIGVVSTKGGTGKTTVAANLAAICADFGMRVLMIDTDPQASLSKYYEITHTAPKGLSHMVLEGGIVSQDNISKTNIENLDLIAANVDPQTYADLQVFIQSRPGGDFMMMQALRAPFITSNYDVVFMDTQGAVGKLQTCVCLASDILLSPTNPSILAAREFSAGTLAMLANLRHVESYVPGYRTPHLYALLNGIERTNDSREFESFFRDTYRGETGVRFLKTALPTHSAYRAAATKQLPAHIYDPLPLGASDRATKRSGTCAYTVLHYLLWEIMPNLHGTFCDGQLVEVDEPVVATEA